MNYEHLIDRAKRRRARAKRPRQTDLRRSVSDAYYAVFHAASELCANVLVGKSKRGSNEWVLCYRSLQHKDAKDAFKKLRSHPVAAIKQFAALFIQLQDERHRADYDPKPYPHGRRQVVLYADQARSSIRALTAVPHDEKIKLAVHLVFKAR